MNKNLKKLLSAICALTVTFSAVSVPASAEDAQTDTAAVTETETVGAAESDGVDFDELERVAGTDWETTFSEKDGFLTWTDPDPTLYPVNPNPVLWECVAEYELFVNGTRIYQPVTQFGADWDQTIGNHVLNGKINHPEVYVPAIISKYIIDGGDTTDGVVITIQAHKTPKDGDTSVVIDNCTTTFDASKFIGSKSESVTKPLVSAHSNTDIIGRNLYLNAGGSSNAAAYVFVYENAYSDGEKEFDYIVAENELALWHVPEDVPADVKFRAYAVDEDGNYGELSQEVSINHKTGAVSKAVPQKIASIPSWTSKIEFDKEGGFLGVDQVPGGNKSGEAPYAGYYLIAVDASGNIAGNVHLRDEWYDPKWFGNQFWAIPAGYIAAYNLQNPDKALNGTYEVYVAADTDNDKNIDKISDSSVIMSYSGGNKAADIEALEVKEENIHYQDNGCYVYIDLPECTDDMIAQGYIAQYNFTVDKEKSTTEFIQGGNETSLWFDGEEQDINVRIAPVDKDGNLGEWVELTVTLGQPMAKWEPNFKYDEKTGILTWDHVRTDVDHGYSYRLYDKKSNFSIGWWTEPQWDDEQQKNVFYDPELKLPVELAKYFLTTGADGAYVYDFAIEAEVDGEAYKGSSSFTYNYGGLETNDALRPKVLFASAHYNKGNRDFPYHTEIHIGAQNAYTKDNVVGYIYDFGIVSDGDVNTTEKPTSVTVYAVDADGKISAPVTAKVLDDEYPESGLVYGNDFDGNLQWDRWQYSKNITDQRYNDLFDITKAAKAEFVLRPNDPDKLSDDFGGAIVMNSESKGWNQLNYWGINDPEHGLFAEQNDDIKLVIVPGKESGTYVISGDVSEFNPFYGLDKNNLTPEYVGISFMIWGNDEYPTFTGTGIMVEQANIYDKDGNLLIRFDNGGHAFTAPENFRLDDGNQKVYLNFNKVFGADHYDIYQDGVVVKTIPQSEDYDISVTIDGLENDREGGYKFKVAAVSKDGIEKFTEEYEAYPNSWQGIGVSYLDKDGNWQWTSGPSEGKEFASGDEAVAYALKLDSKNININIRGKEEVIKNLKALPAGVEWFGINTNPEGKITISAKSISVPNGAGFGTGGNVLFSGKTTISTGANSGLDLSSDLQQDAKSAVTIKGKNSAFLNINNMPNIAAISGFNDMNIYSSKVSGAVKGGYLNTGDTVYNGAVTLTGDLNNGWNCTFAKAVKADGNIMINGATVKGALTAQGTLEAYDCTLASVSITGKKLASYKWDDGNDIISIIENCTTGKIASDLPTQLNINQCKVNGAVTSKGAISTTTYDISDPTTINGAVTAATWLGMWGTTVTGKVTANQDMYFGECTIKGAITGKTGMSIEDSTVAAVSVTGKSAEDSLYVKDSVINGKVSSAAAVVSIHQSSVHGAVNAKGIFEFYGIEGETPESVIDGAVTIGDKTGKSVIYDAKIAGKVTAAGDLELGSVIAEKAVTAKGLLTVSTTEVHDAVSADTLSTNWGGVLRFTALTVSKGGFKLKADDPNLSLCLELIDKNGKPVQLKVGTKNNVVAKKFVGSIEGLNLSEANCYGATLKVDKNKLIVS